MGWSVWEAVRGTWSASHHHLVWLIEITFASVPPYFSCIVHSRARQDIPQRLLRRSLFEHLIRHFIFVFRSWLKSSFRFHAGKLECIFENIFLFLKWYLGFYQKFNFWLSKKENQLMVRGMKCMLLKIYFSRNLRQTRGYEL